MKKVATSILFFLLFLNFTKNVRAGFADPNVPNNKFGIHLAVASSDDLKSAASLVNSSGGDWGYVTLVIDENDRNRDKWQGVFDEARQLHLIPIVRLATSAAGDTWRKPDQNDIQGWIDFLGSLNWVVKNRYIILFNEPNYSKEWGGELDPEGYGELVKEFSQRLKKDNSSYFIMLSGFNETAPFAPPDYLDEQTFVKRMSGDGGINELFKNIDGWASHSYDLNSYERELSMLNNMGLNKDLPVFITEFGWQHAEGLNFSRSFFDAQTVAQKLISGFNWFLEDARIVAFTPFVLNYQGEPFDHFSWQKPGSAGFYLQYSETQSMAKIKGAPVQEQRLESKDQLPKKIIANSTYQIPIRVKNLGQAIWQESDGYEVKLLKSSGNFDYFFSDLQSLWPSQESTVWLYLKTKEKIGKFDFSFAVFKNNSQVSNIISWPLEVINPLTIRLSTSLFPKGIASGDNFKILIYNQKEEIIFQKAGIFFRYNQGEVNNVANLVVGERYRVVLLKPYYLPRQEYFEAKETNNKVSFKSMLPLDFNLDGKFSPEDIWALLKNPKLFFNLL